MATPKETALSISRLTLDEIPESGSNSSPSGSRCHETVAVQPAAARLESFIDEMVASPCMKMAEQDMDVSNTFTKKSGESDVLDINKARQMAIDERHEMVHVLNSTGEETLLKLRTRFTKVMISTSMKIMVR